MTNDIDTAGRFLKWLYRGLLLSLATLIVLYAVSGDSAPSGGDTSNYMTDEISRGPLRSSITALGKLKARTTVEVGSELSGQISAVHADYNDQVSAGDIIAVLDPGTFEARLNEARARLRLAESDLRVQHASVERAQAEMDEKRANWDRKRFFNERGHISEAALDQAKRELAAAQAGLRMEQARVKRVQATVDEAQSAVVQATLDVERTNIRSPADGVIIERTAEPGQTVAASFQAPVLFKIAEDLSEMLVETSVDEADIGLVSEGQSATFTVEAFPERNFEGVVKQVRKAPVDFDNIVTYTTVIAVDNSDQLLLPGMTATVEIATSLTENALRIPSVALAYNPPVEGYTPARGPKSETQATGYFWVLTERGELEQHSAILGARDAFFTELLESDVDEGTTVVTGERGRAGGV